MNLRNFHKSAIRSLSRWVGKREDSVDLAKALCLARDHLCKQMAEQVLPWPADKQSPFIYETIQEPSWVVEAPWIHDSGKLTLQSSRIILISKRNGRILYDGSAGDEG